MVFFTLCTLDLLGQWHLLLCCPGDVLGVGPFYDLARPPAFSKSLKD